MLDDALASDRAKASAFDRSECDEVRPGGRKSRRMSGWDYSPRFPD
jgi:hypothetical protein